MGVMDMFKVKATILSPFKVAGRCVTRLFLALTSKTLGCFQGGYPD